MYLIIIINLSIINKNARLVTWTTSGTFFCLFQSLTNRKSVNISPRFPYCSLVTNIIFDRKIHNQCENHSSFGYSLIKQYTWRHFRLKCLIKSNYHTLRFDSYIVNWQICLTRCCPRAHPLQVENNTTRT